MHQELDDYDDEEEFEAELIEGSEPKDDQDEPSDSDVELEAESVSSPGDNKPDIRFKHSKPDSELNTTVNIPLKPNAKSEKQSDDDVELEPELISAPLKKETEIKFKDSKESIKKPMKTKPDAKPDKMFKVPPKHTANEPDVELDPDLISSPEEKRPDIKFKTPKNPHPVPKPKSPAKIKDRPVDGLGKEPDVEEEAELVSAPSEKKPDVKFKDFESKPRKPLKVKPGAIDTDPNASGIIPLKSSKPTNDDLDIEEEPELVSVPGEKKPDIKFKDPKKPVKKPLNLDSTPDVNYSPKTKVAPKSKPEKSRPVVPIPSKVDSSEAPSKKPLKVKPGDIITDPDGEADIQLKRKPSKKDPDAGEDLQPSTPRRKKSAPKKPSKAKSDELDGEPTFDFNFPMKSKEKSPDDELEPLDQKSGPDSPKGRPKKPLKVRPGVCDTDLDVDADIPLKDDKDDRPSDEENTPPVTRKPRRRRSQKKPKKPVWQIPPRPPPEPYEFPPVEKRLCEILKEEKIEPTKRYAKKPKSMTITLPVVIPWEHLPAIQTQEGMGPFGKTRNQLAKVDHGSKHLVQGQLHSETVIPLFSMAAGASKSGMLPFGAYRKNVSEIIDNHGFNNSKLKMSECIIPKIMQGALKTRDQASSIGFSRSQTINIKYMENMSNTCAPSSHCFISRQFAPTSKEMAGSCIMDRRRNVLPNVQGYGIADKASLASEAIVPRLFDVQDIYTKEGSNFGAFRPLITESEGGYPMTYEEDRLCKLVIPYQTSPSIGDNRRT